MNEYTFTLTREQYDALLIALGMAAATAHSNHYEQLFVRLLRLANEINKNNPNWQPYELPAAKENNAEIQS
jgi:hypothetical protein